MSDEIRDIIRGMIDFEVEFTVSGYKSSEGDGRTAVDIEKELSELTRDSDAQPNSESSSNA